MHTTITSTADQQHLKRRDDCINVSSQELKIPLLSIRHQISSTLGAQASGQLNSSELNYRLKKAESLCDQLAKLINNLVDFSHEDMVCHVPIYLEEVNLCDVTAEVLNLCMDKAVVNKCRLTLDCPQVVKGDWDHGRVEQIITNLVSNAIQNAPGTTIDVRVSTCGNMAHLEISDHGPGIPMSEQSQIFNHFNGLRLVKEITEKLCGTIQLASSPNEGSTFTIELPLKRVLH